MTAAPGSREVADVTVGSPVVVIELLCLPIRIAYPNPGGESEPQQTCPLAESGLFRTPNAYLPVSREDVAERPPCGACVTGSRFARRGRAARIRRRSSDPRRPTEPMHRC